MELHLSDAAICTIRDAVRSPTQEDIPNGVRHCLGSNGVINSGDSAQRSKKGITLSLEDVRWLRPHLSAAGVTVAELIHSCNMELPMEQAKPRDPELEARCQQLRAQQANETYSRMVRNVDSRTLHQPTLNIGKQLREVNAQLVEVGQLLFSVLAGFLFGYMAGAVLGSTDTSRRILCGLAVALIVLVAEGYFLIRYLTAMEHAPAASLQELVLNKKQKQLEQEREAQVRRAKARETAARLTATASSDEKKQQ